MSALPILCYHNVGAAPGDATFKLLYVSPEMFDRQLWTLQRLGLRGVSMSEGLARLASAGARGSVVLTFDDGYADTLTTAAPIMQQYGFSATCYVVSGAVGTHNLWDADLVGETKPLMSRAQLDQWLACGMEVGSHSASHPRLCDVAPEALPEELAGSRAALRTMLGVAVDHFAYPFGQFSDDVVEAVRHAGYSSAVTTVAALARARDDRLRLPRLLVNGEHGLWRFLLRMALPRPRRHQVAGVR